MNICQECLEAEGKMILAVNSIEVDGESRWFCPTCYESVTA